ncbi:unnamed protein product [Penicillium discolor]
MRHGHARGEREAAGERAVRAAEHARAMPGLVKHPAPGCGHPSMRQSAGPTQRHELLHPIPPVRLRLRVEVVVAEPGRVRVAESTGDDLARAAQQTAADEDRVEEALVHPEPVERDHGNPVGQRLDRRRRAHRDQTGGGLESGRHRRVREHEIRRAAPREETGVRIAVEGGDRCALLRPSGHEGLRGEDDVRRPGSTDRPGCSADRTFRQSDAARTPGEPSGRRGFPESAAAPPLPPPREGQGRQSERRPHPDARAELGEGTALAVRVHDQQVGVPAVVERPALGRDRHTGEPRDGHGAMRQRIDDSAEEADERSPAGEQHDVRTLRLQPFAHTVEVQPRDRVGAEPGPRQRGALLGRTHRQLRAHQQELRPQVGHGTQQRRRPLHEGVGVRDAHDAHPGAGGHAGTRRSFAIGARSLSNTRLTPSPTALSMTRMSRTRCSRPPGSSDAAWSEPHIVRSSVMWRSTATAPIATAASEICRPRSCPE